jgi:hypothetical protein
VPEAINDNDPALESVSKSVRDQGLDLGEPWPLPEDFLLKEQVYASCWIIWGLVEIFPGFLGSLDKFRRYRSPQQRI